MKKEKHHKSEDNLCNLTLQSGLGCPTTGSNRSQHGNKSLSTKTLANSFYNNQLRSCLISSPGRLLVTLVYGTQWHCQSEHWMSGPQHSCMLSTQNITVKADTHFNIYSHIQTELTAKLKTHQTLEYLYSIVLSTGSQKVISMASTDQCRSGPRHSFPLYGVCLEEHYCKSIHTLTLFLTFKQN